MVEATANVEMAAAWDGEEGEAWTRNADRYEAATGWASDRLRRGAEVANTSRVLDVGCGTGRTTLDMARVASSGRAVGVDLSARMLALATRRAGDEGIDNVDFVHADVQVHPFEPAGFDAVISSFGAMFFDDPVAAFANIRRALTTGGRLALLAWRPLEENEWLMTMRHALAMGRTLPSPPLNGPGPFGLAGADHARRVLERAGFVDIELTPVDEPVWLGRDAEDAWAFVAGMGIVRGLTGDLDDARKQGALDRCRAAIGEHETEAGVMLGSAAWLITAGREA